MFTCTNDAPGQRNSRGAGRGGEGQEEGVVVIVGWRGEVQHFMFPYSEFIVATRVAALPAVGLVLVREYNGTFD